MGGKIPGFKCRKGEGRMGGEMPEPVVESSSFLRKRCLPLRRPARRWRFPPLLRIWILLRQDCHLPSRSAGEWRTQHLLGLRIHLPRRIILDLDQVQRASRRYLNVRPLETIREIIWDHQLFGRHSGWRSPRRRIIPETGGNAGYTGQ